MAKKTHGGQVFAGKTTRGGKDMHEQTHGQNERDPKRRKGQYGGAGDPPLMKK